MIARQIVILVIIMIMTIMYDEICFNDISIDKKIIKNINDYNDISIIDNDNGIQLHCLFFPLLPYMAFEELSSLIVFIVYTAVVIAGEF